MLDADGIRQLTDTIRAYGELFAVGFLVFGTVISGIIALFVKSRISLNKAHADLAASQKELADTQKQGAKDLPAVMTAVGDNMATKVVDALSPVIRRQDETITSQDLKLKDLQTQIDAQCALLQKQTEKVDALQQSLTAKDNELKETTNKLNQANETIAQQAEQLAELATLKEQVKTLTAEVEQLKAKVKMQEALELELKTVRAERDAEKARADTLAGQLQRTQAQLDKALADLADEKRLHALHETGPLTARAEISADAPPKPAETAETVAG